MINFFSVTRKLIDISSNSMLDGTAYLSPVMSMSVAKPVTSKRSKRFADSFDEFDMMEKRQVKYRSQRRGLFLGVVDDFMNFDRVNH